MTVAYVRCKFLRIESDQKETSPPPIRIFIIILLYYYYFIIVQNYYDLEVEKSFVEWEVALTFGGGSFYRKLELLALF